MELLPRLVRTALSRTVVRRTVVLGAVGLLAATAAQALAQGGATADSVEVVQEVAEAAENPAQSWDGLKKFGIVLALIVLPMIIGGWLAKRLRMPEHGWKFALAIGSLAAAAVVVSMGEIKLGPDLSGGITLIYELQETAEAEGQPQEGDAADADAAAADVNNPFADMDRNDRMALLIKALTERVDPAGIKEVSIKKFGEDQIEIIIPNATQQELANIERRIYTAGALAFRITASRQFDEHQPIIEIAERAPEGQDIIKQPGGGEVARWVPFKLAQFGGSIESATSDHGLVTRMSGDTPQALIMTDDGLNVTGGYLRQARADFDSTGNPAVSFTFDAMGAELFGTLTGTHLPNQSGARYQLGILLDNELLSAPSLRTRISDSGIIEGSMSQEEVDFLAGVLNAGSLPAALNKTPISRAQISPTLGALTVEQGKRALIISLALVALFMAFYYRFAGFVTWIGLAANMLLIVGSMVLIKAAFTLPGLAGLVLTIGMSVDANVLIFERIREELARGAALRMAIRNGFSRATSAIIDSNVTNLITGIVIYKIAPDNVKGFGVTLVLGCLMSVFTAVFLMRIVFDVAERKGWIKTLHMRQIVGETHFDFLRWRGVAYAASLALIAVGIAAAVGRLREGDLFDIDFTGGSSVTVVLDDDKKMTFAQVTELLENDPAFAESSLSLVEMDKSNTRYTVTTTNQNVEEVEDLLSKAFGERLRTYNIEVTDLAPIAEDETTDGESTSTSRWLPGGLLDATLPLSFVSLQEPSAEPADEPAADEAPAEEPAAESDGEEAPAEEEAAPADSPAATEPPASSDTAADAPDEADAEQDDAVGSVFTGGTSATLTFTGDESTEGVSHETLSRLVADALEASGRKDAAYRLSNPNHRPGSIRAFKEWEIRLALPQEQASEVLDALAASTNSQPIFPLSNKIGGRVAGRMAADAIAAVVLCLAGIIAYIWFRFHGVVYGLAAVVALVHDVFFALGAVALSSYFVDFADPLADALMIEKFQINLTLVAAFLTIIGYSLNDTIVIFDRIREVKGKSPKLTADMINLSVNQTLARTILTAITTLLSTAVLYIFGGEGIHAFAFALLVGFVAGCYSTIYIANPVLLWLSDRFEQTDVKAAARAAAL
jgi:SecD/SecF fusion protein